MDKKMKKLISILFLFSIPAFSIAASFHQKQY